MNSKDTIALLLVECNPPDASRVGAFLQAAAPHCAVTLADSLYEALLLASNTPFDIALLNPNLPDSSGFRTVSTFLEKTKNLPLILLLPADHDALGTQAVKAGAQDVLVRGQFDAKMLGKAVRFALLRSKTRFQNEELTLQLERHRKRSLEARRMNRLGMWEMDLVNNKMSWSDEMFHVFSLPVGSTCPSLSEYLLFAPPDDRPQLLLFFEHAAKDGLPHQLSHRIVVDGLNTRQVMLRAQLLAADDERILLAGTLQDISDLAAREKPAPDPLPPSSPPPLPGNLLADLGFQVRTPLASIVNLLYLIENDHPAGTPAVLDLKKSVNELSAALNQLLNLSLLDDKAAPAGNTEIMLADLLKGIENLARMKADTAGLRLVFRTDPGLPPKISANPGLLSQLCHNLTEQFFSLCNRDAEIRLQVSGGAMRGKQLQLNFLLACDKLLLPKKRLLSLFSPGLEGHLPTPGAFPPTADNIYKALLRSANGNLTVNPREEPGTAVEMSIPVGIPWQSVIFKNQKPDAPLGILLVEDHALNQIATSRVLTAWSELVTVDIAENGLVAVEKCRADSYDLVLMDLQMPVMDGFEAARQIRAFSQVPIIALTASAKGDEHEKCLRCGMNDCLLKPFKPKELYHRIAQLLSLVLS